MTTTPSKGKQPQEQNLYQVITFFMGLVVFVGIVYIILAIQLNHAWQFYAEAGVALLLLPIFWQSRKWVQNGRLADGVQFALYSIILSILASGLLIANAGVLFSILLLTVIFQMAVKNLSIQQNIQVFTLAILIGLFLILIDTFQLFSYRFDISSSGNFVSIFSIVITIIFTFLLIRDYQNYSVQTKLIVATITVAVVAVVSNAYIINRVTRNSLIANLNTELNALAKSQGLVVGEQMAHQIETLKILTLNDIVEETVTNLSNAYTGDEITIYNTLVTIDEQWINAADNSSLILSRINNRLAAELLSYQQLVPGNAELFLTDRYGALVAATNRTSDFYQADEAWWQEAYNNNQGKIYVGSPEFDESSNTLGVNIAIPIFSNDPDKPGVTGILRTTYQLEPLVNLLEDDRFQGGGHADIVVPGGQQIHSIEEGVYELRQINPDSNLWLQLQNISTNNIFLNENYEEQASFISLAPVNTTSPDGFIQSLGWAVVVHRPESEALQPIQTQQRTNTLIGVLIVIGTGVTAILVGRLLTEPITHLTQIAERVRGGDLTARAVVNTNDEIHSLAVAFNEMTTQLKDSIENLEHRVAERTHALQTSIQVSRNLSTILDSNQLTKEVVEQIRSAFNYYHTHIYLWDKEQTRLLMVGGTGEAGQAMLSAGHYIPSGKGLVGRAAALNQVILVPNVSQEKDWLPNRLLPETRSEVAVPIAIGNRVLGVLDVQHSVVDGLKQLDAELLLSIANQLAVALQNATLLGKTREQAERQSLVNEIGQQIQGATTVERAMQIAVRELGRAVGASRTRVQLVNEQTTPANGHKNQ